VVVELLVVLVADLAFRAHPEGTLGVQPLRIALAHEPYRYRQMIGVGLDDLAQSVGFQILLGILLEVQGDARSPRRSLIALGEREAATAVGLPAPALLFAGAPGVHDDAIRHHEGGIEA